MKKLILLLMLPCFLWGQITIDNDSSVVQGINNRLTLDVSTDNLVGGWKGVELVDEYSLEDVTGRQNSLVSNSSSNADVTPILVTDKLGNNNNAIFLTSADTNKYNVYRRFDKVISANGNVQGISYHDGYYYETAALIIQKRDSTSTVLASATQDSCHFGGTTYYDNSIYIFANRDDLLRQYVYKYDLDLALETVYDVSAQMDNYSGGMCYYDNKFYLVQSDDLYRNDVIFSYDTDFNFIQADTLNITTALQGIEYLKDYDVFQLNSHTRGFYRVNTDFSDSSIVLGYMTFDMQDLHDLGDGNILYCNRGRNEIITIPSSYAPTSTNILDSDIGSLSAWVKFDNPTSGAREVVGGLQDLTVNRYDLTIVKQSAGNLSFYAPDVAALTAASVFTNTDWNMITGTIGNGSISLYLNGELYATQISAYGSVRAGTDIIFGKDINSTSYFSGGLSDIYIYSSCLTAEEVKEIYTSTKSYYSIKIEN